MNILTGTASWTDKTLIECGRFYPPGCTTAECRLRHYASLFPLVEVDSSYYAIPAAATAQLWAERTPQGFIFNVKAFRALTGHAVDPQVLPRDLRQALLTHDADRKRWYHKDLPDEIVEAIWQRSIEALRPLQAAGKLGLVHFQFAPWVTNVPKARAHLEDCSRRLSAAGMLMSVEFRNRSWFAGEADGPCATGTLHLLRELGAVHTVVDEPQVGSGSIPTLWSSTSPHAALLRLHGRNRETWQVKTTTAAERFVYDYSEAELSELLPAAMELAGQIGRLHVVFNNCFEDQGQRNALTFMQLLARAQGARPQ